MHTHIWPHTHEAVQGAYAARPGGPQGASGTPSVKVRGEDWRLTMTISSGPDTVRDCAELERALHCYDIDEIQRLLWRTHDLEIEVEELDEIRGARLRLRCEDCSLDVTFPITVARFWDEVDQLEAYVQSAALARDPVASRAANTVALALRSRETALVLSDLWPTYALTIRTPRLALRLPTDEELAVLADLAGRGVHERHERPFLTPWTEGTPEDRARFVLRDHWADLASWDVNNWHLGLGAFLEDVPVGMMSLRLPGPPPGRDVVLARPRLPRSRPRDREPDRPAHPGVRPPGGHCRRSTGNGPTRRDRLPRPMGSVVTTSLSLGQPTTRYATVSSVSKQPSTMSPPIGLRGLIPTGLSMRSRPWFGMSLP